MNATNTLSNDNSQDGLSPRTPRAHQKAGAMEQLEHLLLNLAEVCEEVAQRAHDAARLGMSEVQPGQTRSTGERFWKTMNDVAALSELLASLSGEGCLSRAAVDAKKAKVEAYLRYPTEGVNSHTGQA